MKRVLLIIGCVLLAIVGACDRGPSSVESAAMALYRQYADNEQGVTVAYIGDYHAYEQVFNAVVFQADDSVQWRWLQDEFGVIDPGELSPGMEARSGVTMVSLHIDTTLQFGSPEEEQAYIDSMVQQLIAETLGERAMTDTNVFVGTVSSVDSLLPQDLYSQLSRHRSFDQNRAADGSAEYIIRADMENRTLLCFFCETPEDANLLVRWLNERDTE